MVALLAVLGLVCGPFIRAVADYYDDPPSRGGPPGPGPGSGKSGVLAARWSERAGVEVGAAVVVALVGWRAGVPYAGFALVGFALAVIDQRTYTLPDLITLPAYPLLALTLLPTGELPAALLGGLALAACYGLLWFLRPDAMGLGDVKLAGLIGMAAAALGWQAWVVAAFAGQVCGALYAVALVAGGGGSRRTEFPFGPFMVLGALAALCLGL
ncbi:prepilin peptidase [Nonomuraea pusilla]|uniref:Leader peptidase (Prepilin peptidase) / N-methyltransferase n=1 Tax=Nonomuraea pusilla TaxID=46177 RepID=A0A1H7L826_9ACTN|nr:A24 family peptidase [Nonomuraea pusilla]SEK95203.1 leader peptidase (prepilin peptidase) / N-methyltransferase [Nonomuraea pusilla]